MNRLLRYFDLRLRVFDDDYVLRGGKAIHRRRPGLANTFTSIANNIVVYHILIYISIVLGAVSKTMFSYYTDSMPIPNAHIVISIIVAAVIYPQVSRNSGIDPDNPHPMHVFLAYQGGFFWNTIIATIAKL